ncbi:hypothetical protein J1N35_000415 [Gossypium stocksii]|uniref:Uncharacterized protein n=1 Tax=Gossypium stocksii TaxID=47602 RepID=A0A9D3WH16_9ROSI|nr:hypothetical protein J1N35_000415 [Gossypium stocksii]
MVSSSGQKKVKRKFVFIHELIPGIVVQFATSGLSWSEKPYKGAKKERKEESLFLLHCPSFCIAPIQRTLERCG